MTIEQTPRHSHRIDWIDYARLFSAAAVVLFHYLYNGVRTGKIVGSRFVEPLSTVASYGYLGVNLFFVISGFFIMRSVDRATPASFAVSRIVRLYPAFLLCLLLTGAVIVLSGRSDLAFTPGQFFANLTMMASTFGIRDIDGVYWTLALEIMFYVAVWLIMLLRRQDQLETILIGWLALLTVAVPLRLELPLLGTAFPLFALGCSLWFGHRLGWTKRRCAVLAYALALSVVGAALRAKGAGGVPVNVAVAGASSIAFAGTFLLFNRWQMPMPGARFAGALTYPLYLLHCYAGYIVISALLSVMPLLPAVAIAAVGAVLASLCVVAYERRYAFLFKRWAANLVSMLTLTEPRSATRA